MADRLSAYRDKRRSSTPEPKGRDSSSVRGRGSARFVIQEHSATRLHWDLRLEHDGALASWALPTFLPHDPGDNRLAVRTEDHPIEYLEFKGEIPAGSYGAGTMSIFDFGTFDVLKWEERKVEVELHGREVSGRWALFPIGKEAGDANWLVHRMKADPGGWRTDWESMPEGLVPMLARTGGLPGERDRWAYEIKWDGVRALCHSTPGHMHLRTRNGNEVTDRYPELGRMNRALHHHSVILDGEVVAFDAHGRPSFEALQGRMHLTRQAAVRRLAKESPVTYVAFDLLWLDGHSTMELTYEQRRELLSDLALDSERWQTPEHHVGDGAALLEASRSQGLEGIVAKRLGSQYEPGRRSGSWVKVKNTNRQEVVIGGWMPGRGRRSDTIGALLAGVNEDGALRYAGRVGAGFTDAELDRLKRLLAPLAREHSPFDLGSEKVPREARFVESQLICEVEFVEWTRDGLLRGSSYKGLRDDKDASGVVRELPGKNAGVMNGGVESIGGREVKITNRDKVLYPKTGFAKGDLIDYYVAMAPVLLPHLEGRALTLKRYPDGVDGKFFYEKNAPSHRPPWVHTEHVQGIDYVVVDDVATLAWLGNLADLELHTPMARADAADRPTMVAFDLDPGSPATITECCAVALLLRSMFEGLGLKLYAKTSGSKGMQVYLPLNNGHTTAVQAKEFAKAVAQLLEADVGDKVVSRQKKELRKGKVLVDWSQNDEYKTTVSVYSPRAMERPTVSTPISWDEVADGANGKELVFDVGDVRRRVDGDGDLFADVLSVVQELPNAPGS